MYVYIFAGKKKGNSDDNGEQIVVDKSTEKDKKIERAMYSLASSEKSFQSLRDSINDLKLGDLYDKIVNLEASGSMPIPALYNTLQSIKKYQDVHIVIVDLMLGRLIYRMKDYKSLGLIEKELNIGRKKQNILADFYVMVT